MREVTPRRFGNRGRATAACTAACLFATTQLLLLSCQSLGLTAGHFFLPNTPFLFMSPVSIPIPAAVQADVTKLLQQALAKLMPYQISLTNAEQKSLASTAMGQGSVAFATEAGQLLTNYPQVLRRTITDADIAGYPLLLDTFSAASDLAVQVDTLASLLSSVTLVAGTSVMGTARSAYADGQNDKGKTPGVHAIVERMSTRFS